MIIKKISAERIIIQLATVIDPDQLHYMVSLANYLQRHEKVYECIFSYHELSLHVSPDVNEILIEDFISGFRFQEKESYTATWKIPVLYDIENEDFLLLCSKLRLKPDDLIQLHSNVQYTLYFYGFLPGFMYLGGLPEELHLPRKQNPDRMINPGSVAIGGRQTGIYPRQSPGGWYVIGSCPLQIFRSDLTPPVSAQPGDHIIFEPIDNPTYNRLKGHFLDDSFRL